MTPLVRGAWASSALFFATLLASLSHLDYVTLPPQLLLLAFAMLAAVRPFAAIQLLAAAVPVVWSLFVTLDSWRVLRRFTRRGFGGDAPR